MNDKDFIFHETGSAGLVVAFASYGIDGQPGANPIAVPRLEFMSTLKRHNLSCVLLKDSRQHWYHGGADGFSKSIRETADRLRSLRPRYQHIVTLGHSMGGYAALLFANLALLDSALATAPQTFIDRPNRVHFQDNRWGQKIMEMRELYSPTFYDLADAFQWAPPHANSLNLFVGEDSVDLSHAEHFGQVRGTRIIKLPDSDHNAAKKLRDLGHLDALLGLIGLPQKFEEYLSNLAAGNPKSGD